jgi:hypothetical protein
MAAVFFVPGTRNTNWYAFDPKSSVGSTSLMRNVAPFQDAIVASFFELTPSAIGEVIGRCAARLACGARAFTPSIGVFGWLLSTRIVG